MFDLKQLAKNKARAYFDIQNSDFYHFICEDIVDRIISIKADFNKILLLNPIIADKILALLKPHYVNSEIIVHNSSELDSSQTYDLIIYPFDMHWENDVQLMLKKLNLMLGAKGILIANFAGTGTLKELKSKLISAEQQSQSAHFAHISPFIRFDDVTSLLKQAGYVENIIDIIQLELEYQNPIALMKALKKFGESNVLFKRTNYAINKTTYQQIKNYPQKEFIDYINLISFTASPQKGTIKLK